MHRSRIPRNRPVLLAPNHQLAFMDAMSPLMTSRRDIVFLTRADVFNKNFIARILRVMKMLPVYRIRDGAGELAKNEAIFEEAFRVLLRCKCPVCVMPEGNHGNKRRLRPIVKGIFRIAFKAQEEYGARPGVVIVPVGLDYSGYTNFRAKLYVHYGHPVEVSEYYAEYLENPARTLNSIRMRLAEEMRKGMIDIRSEDHYDMYMQLRETYNRRMRERMGLRKKDLHHRFLADNHMISELEKSENGGDERIPRLSVMCTAYSEGVKVLGLRDWVLGRTRHPFAPLVLAGIGMLAFLPVFLFGALVNLPVYKIPDMASRKVKDRQFKTSFKFVIGVFLTPVYYFILFALAWLIPGPGWTKWAFLVSLPLTGLFAHVYLIWFKKLRSLWKCALMTLRNNTSLKKLKDLRTNILQITDDILSH